MSSFENFSLVSILICTFKRDSLEETLSSLAKINIDENIHLEIIVVDNDPLRSAGRIVDNFCKKNDISVRYGVETAKNISILRNLCLDLAKGDYIAFIDDDEIADPEWLEHLLLCMKNYKADAVIGRVIADYDSAGHAWIRAGEPLSRAMPETGTVLLTGATNNSLLTREIIQKLNLRFDLQFGTTGGEDSAFFKALVAGGGRIVAAPDAIVRETVPASRLSWAWLKDRALRNGFLYAWQNYENLSAISRFKLMIRFSVYVVIAILWFGLTRFVSPKGSVSAWMKIFLNIGKIRSLMGKAPPRWI
jgi:succinoglycan biosynthesis protein ExoM